MANASLLTATQSKEKNMSKSPEDIWKNCLKIIKDNVNQQSFKTWFEPIKPIKLEKNVLTIQVPSQFFYEWLEEHYVKLLRKTLQRELDKNARLEYQIVMDSSSAQKTPFTVNIPTYSTGESKNPEVLAPIV